MGMEEQEGIEETEQLEEIVEVEPEIVYFTDEVDSNSAILEQEDVENENYAVEISEEQIMPLMPFDLTSSYVYLVEDTEINVEDCEEEGEDSIEQSNEEQVLEISDVAEHVGSIPRCEICKQNYRDPKELRMHYENFHVRVKKPVYSCHICKKNFDTSAMLKAHDQSPCTDKNKIQCKECGSEFASTYLFSHHYKIEHEKKLVCVVCKKAHTNEAALMQHLQLHKQTKYTCDKCGEKCDSIYEFIQHNKTHKKTLLYACNKCDAEFSDVPDLAFHIRQQHGKVKKLDPVLK